MPAEDFKPRTFINRHGKEAVALHAPDLRQRLTEVDCGCWARATDLAGFTKAVVDRLTPKGFALSEFEAASLARLQPGDSLGSDVEFPLLERAITWANESGPDGYHLGMKLMDLWFMPASWWEDTGGDERHSPEEA